MAKAARARANLHADAIIEAALSIAARGEQVTFRALGTALDADPTAVYRHFRDKGELLRAVYDRMLLEVLSQVDRTASWRDQLRQLADLSWRISEKHPHVAVHATVLTTGGPGELGCVDLMLGLLHRLGLQPDEMVRYYGVLANYILSTSANIAAQRIAMADSRPLADSAWLYDLRGIDPERYPWVAANRGALSLLEFTDVYLMGIEVLLDAVEAVAAQRTPVDQA